MDEVLARTPVYHVVLVGIDVYEHPRIPSLRGCVNDVTLVEEFLRQAAAAGRLPGRLEITRLVSRHPPVEEQAALQEADVLPTKENLVAALRSLAGPRVPPDDHVLVFYSGHGHQLRWQGEETWHEALVPYDARFLYDVELNALIEDITVRTTDLTLVLDSCHSGGAFRDLTDDADVADRFLGEPSDGHAPASAPRADQAASFTILPPDPAIAGPERRAAPVNMGERRSGMWQDTDPPYLVVAACEADETAHERPPHDRDVLADDEESTEDLWTATLIPLRIEPGRA